ncbi:hypothetical protein [Enterovibrio paralichthyis]|nr:hypothetical protein [Enterovibrio paralichthyis]
MTTVLIICSIAIVIGLLTLYGPRIITWCDKQLGTCSNDKE